MLELPSMKDDTMSVAILWSRWTSFRLSKHAYWLKTGSQGLCNKEYTLALSFFPRHYHLGKFYLLCAPLSRQGLEMSIILVKWANININILAPLLYSSIQHLVPKQDGCTATIQISMKLDSHGLHIVLCFWCSSEVHSKIINLPCEERCSL